MVVVGGDNGDGDCGDGDNGDDGGNGGGDCGDGAADNGGGGDLFCDAYLRPNLNITCPIYVHS